MLPPANILLPKEEVIPATRRRRTGPIATRPPCSESVSHPVMEIKIMFPANSLQDDAFWIEI
jgi:hypothetical protein